MCLLPSAPSGLSKWCTMVGALAGSDEKTSQAMPAHHRVSARQCRIVTKYIYFVTLLEWIFLLSTCNEVHYFKTTFTCNEVRLEGNFRNVTKYRCRQAKVLKAILFPLSIAICVFILYFK